MKVLFITESHYLVKLNQIFTQNQNSKSYFSNDWLKHMGYELLNNYLD